MDAIPNYDQLESSFWTQQYIIVYGPNNLVTKYNVQLPVFDADPHQQWDSHDKSMMFLQY